MTGRRTSRKRGEDVVAVTRRGATRPFVNTNPDPQLTVLAWIVYGALVACIAAIAALVRSGRSVPPLGGFSIDGSGPGAQGGRPGETASRSPSRRVNEGSRPMSGGAAPSSRGR